ncbi:uncharacterized protein NESG_01175 [Nematocida ausubeli]|uniref:rRNA biogenesis protein RRP36 n=1 Tax=Nematocida ausubeli (strain ATCC PRA-371 / ERTm2) TaxID=1913371 RepID=A0A086J1P4_NEMA1|nr:uncharacterized protein NESG_01175 [Nematocida ausubeli]KAI5150441.1 hypothetical protein NEAUS05_2173 [Nematocida ausubeli]KFG26062.1 hypothetical protein NESG_01175 [Nematocida ausubeli]
MDGNKDRPREVSSTDGGRRHRRDNEIVRDPRFFNREINPLYLAEAYSFLYDKEEEQLAEKQKRGEDVKKQLERVEARKRLLHLKRLQKEARETEMERVKEGKTPFYLSRKQAKVMQTLHTAKTKGVDHVLSKLKKKQKERDNKSRRAYE